MTTVPFPAASSRQTSIRRLLSQLIRVLTYPRSKLQGPSRKDDYELFAVNVTTIATYGTILLSLNLSLRRAFKWRFIVPEPIIGIDFLSHYGLLVDPRNRRLIDRTTNRTRIHGRFRGRIHQDDHRSRTTIGFSPSSRTLPVHLSSDVKKSDTVWSITLRPRQGRQSVISHVASPPAASSK
jgi:hypothetical protein